VLDPGVAAPRPEHGHDIEADPARPVRGGPQVRPGQPPQLGLLGRVDRGRRGAVAGAPPGLDLAEHQKPGPLGDHVDLARLAAPVAGHDPQAGRGQPGAGERFTASSQVATIGGVLGRHGGTLAVHHPELDEPAKNVENPSRGGAAEGADSEGIRCGVGPPGGLSPGRRGLEYRLRSGDPRSVENARALPTRRDVFLDERGAGLRVTWHPERDLVVLSVWQDDGCVGTFRMSVQDVPRLSGLLAAALDDRVDHPGTDPDPGDPDAGRST
jgi:hypothetical protein